MSSVVISGDTSGTVTLQAPAVAGTTTLTLPATSGTVITGAGGVTGVASGGTGAATLTANNVILGAGTSAVTFVAPGSTGNVLTSNGTTWTSAAASGGQLQTEIFTAPGTWTKPASATTAKVTVIGAGGGGSNPTGGGAGGIAKAYVTGLSGPVSVTVGTGGTGGGTGNGTPGGTSSFGPAVSATGGAINATAPGAQNGTGTVASGTALITSNIARVSGPTISGPSLVNQYVQIVQNAWGAAGGTNPSTVAVSYTQASGIMAGAAGIPSPASPSPGRGATGGLVIVEFVG